MLRMPERVHPAPVVPPRALSEQGDWACPTHFPDEALRIASTMRRAPAEGAKVANNRKRFKRKLQSQATGADRHVTKARRVVSGQAGVLAMRGGAGKNAESFSSLLTKFDGARISDGGLAHYFLSEAVRRFRHVARQPLGNPPASTAAIDELPPVQMAQMAYDDMCCSICHDSLDLYAAGAAGAGAGAPHCEASDCDTQQMPCSHVFHKACLTRWLQRHNSCPYCRAQIESSCPYYNAAHKSEIMSEVSILPRHNVAVLRECVMLVSQWSTMTEDTMNLICSRASPLREVLPVEEVKAAEETEQSIAQNAAR